MLLFGLRKLQCLNHTLYADANAHLNARADNEHTDAFEIGIELVLVSQAISGAISKWSTTLPFASAGALVLLVVLWAAIQPAPKTFGDSLAQDQSSAKTET